MNFKHHPAQVLAWSENQCQQGVNQLTGSVWIPSAASAILGISQLPQHELNLQSIAKQGVNIIRRQSGGGAVILDETVLCFECFAPAGEIHTGLTIRESFSLLTAPVCAAIRDLTGIEPVIAGISDLAIGCKDGLRKVCGCAQMRKRQAVLVHGSILVNTELARLESLLAWPSETPEYRKRRSHKEFCLPLHELMGAQIDISILAERIRASCVQQGWNWLEIPMRPTPEEALLMCQKYENPEWNLNRRRPASNNT